MQDIHDQLYKLQNAFERQWPFPAPQSTFNLGGRDVLITALIVAAFLVVSRQSTRLALLVLAVACYLEPAILVFPFNVLHGIVVRTPRYFPPLVIEPKLQHLLTHFETIRSEALALHPTQMPLFESVNENQRNIAHNQPWRVFPLFAYGTVNEENCARMPILSGLVRQIPSIRLAMLSVMEGGAMIPLHCGFFKSVLRVHLCLYVDREDGERYIEVGGEKYSWKQGELVCFDDTYPHRVFNAVPGRRIVLFLDVDRPVKGIAKAMSSFFLKLMRSSPNVQKHAALQETVTQIK
jgi:beta-hydroxylase